MRAGLRTAAAPLARVPAVDRFGVLAIGITFFSCLILQRFGVPITESSKLNLVTPVVALVVGVALITGKATFAPRRLAVYCCLVGWVLICYAYTQQIDRQFALRGSLPSLLHFLILYLPFTVTLTVPLTRDQVFGLFQIFMIVLAVAGIVQFFAQFGGISVFSFRDWVPDDFSVEPIFNVVIPVGSSSFNKSNGFFLVEPSVMSQMMAMAIIVEMMRYRRLHLLGLFGFALVLTVSGTGMLVGFVFGICILTRPDILSPRLVGSGLLLACLLALIIFVAIEDVGRMLLHRATEVGEERTSGWLRFVTPFTAMTEIFDRYPHLGVFGLGPGSSENIDIGYRYSLHAPWKILLEYGVTGMLVWISLVVYSVWRAGEMPIIVPALFMFLFTGGYQQFGPMIFLLFALFSFPPRYTSRGPVPRVGGAAWS